MKDELLLNVRLVRPEHASQMEGCTHACRHVLAALDEGKDVAPYTVRFLNAFSGKIMNAALCRECYVRLPRENELSEN